MWSHLFIFILIAWASEAISKKYAYADGLQNLLFFFLREFGGFSLCLEQKPANIKQDRF